MKLRLSSPASCAEGTREGSSGAAHRKATLGRARGGAMRPCGGGGEARQLGLSAGEGEGKKKRERERERVCAAVR